MSALNGALRDWFSLVGGAVGKELPPPPPTKAVRRPTRYTKDFPAGVNYTSTRVKAQAETQALLAQLSHDDMQKVNSLLRKKFITAPDNLDKPVATRVTTPEGYMDASAIRKHARKTGDTAEGVRALLRSLHNK